MPSAIFQNLTDFKRTHKNIIKSMEETQQRPYETKQTNQKKREENHTINNIERMMLCILSSYKKKIVARMPFITVK